MGGKNKGKHINFWLNGDVEKLFNEIQSSTGESTTDLLKTAIKYYGLYGLGIDDFVDDTPDDWPDKNYFD